MLSERSWARRFISRNGGCLGAYIPIHPLPPWDGLEEAGRAGLFAVAHNETFWRVTDDETSVLEPVPIALKILVDAESRQVLGVHAIGRHAAELVNIAAVAIRSGMTIEQLSEITFVHPSLAETIQACLPKLGLITAG